MQIGYSVRILDRSDWDGWVPEMNRCIGREGIVVELSSPLNQYCRVAIPGQESWNYPYDGLEILGCPGCPLGHGPNNTHVAQELPR
jgi:hypothetical protein